MGFQFLQDALHQAMVEKLPHGCACGERFATIDELYDHIGDDPWSDDDR